MEIIRRTLRRIISTDSWFYRTCAAAVDFAVIVRRCGLKTYLLLLKVQRANNGDHVPVSVSFNNLLHPMSIRPGTDDAKTAIDNIVREEWGRFEPEQEPQLMIDGGAYIGDSAAYFLSRFSALNVIALEPDPFTYRALTKNLAPYGARVKTLNSGLYSHEGTIRFSGEQTAAAISDNGDREISVTTIPALLEEGAISHVDILKLDIEGAEEPIFSSMPERWLKYVDWLMIEFHSDRGESTISSILKQNGFTMRQHRSVWYCQNENRSA
jgi:FkbM family methyltransferase